MRTLLIGFIALALFSSSCGDPVPGPEPVAREVIMALTAKPSRSNLEPIYERLSSATKDALKRRADELRRVTGSENLRDWETLGPGNLFHGDRVSKVSLLEESDVSAKVEVTMTTFVKDSSDTGAEDTKSVIITLVKEDGQWRVDLPLGAPST